MSQIITCQNDLTGKFCQIKLTDGNKILISIAENEIKISKLVLGIIPASLIFQLSIFELLSGIYPDANNKLITKSGNFDVLDGLKERLLECNTLTEVTIELNNIFKKQQANALDDKEEKKEYRLNLDFKTMNLLEKKAKLENRNLEAVMDEVIRDYVDAEKLETYPDPKIEDVIYDLKNIDKVSISYLQRKYEIGYYHAERILNELTIKGVLESEKDNKPRKVKN